MASLRCGRVLPPLLALGILASCAPAGPPDPAVPETRRRVLLVTVDTMRADHLDPDTTPFLDALLEEGFRFTHAVTPVPRTTPALASLMTGAYPHTTGVRTLTDSLAPERETLAQRLAQRGYRTLAVVSNHMLGEERGLGRGFEVYDFADDSRDAGATTDAALSRAEAVAPDEAVFLWVHYIDPHVPYHPPPELAARADPDYSGPYRLQFGGPVGAIGQQAYPEDLGKERAVFRNDLPEPVNAHIRKLHAAEVRHTDEQIARLLAGLRERLGDDWLVVVSADHGESLGEHDYFYDHGDYVYNASLRVPLGIVFAPGDPLAGSGRIDAWVSLVDLAPTLAELLGLPETVDWGLQVEGRSLVPYLRGESPPPRPVFAESGHSFFPHLVRRRVRFDTEGGFRAVIDGDRKLIWTPGQSRELRFELYDLRSDPQETRDLSASEPDDTQRLSALLESWTRVGAPPAQPLSAEDRERLERLGYLQPESP